ncbi:uncharacterized protein E1O_05080 [Burkholderiales bacterium GJ-E10]|nr:uncharacterized protein E1O_05080 [Burkholderiales bacterium GJ-E10]
MKKVLVVSLLVATPFLFDTASAQQMMDGMNGMNMGQESAGTMSMMALHHATGVVKAIDPRAGHVTIAHGPVRSLNWPAMTMTFTVRNKKLLDKLTEGKKVDFDFVQKGGNYIVTAVR